MASNKNAIHLINKDVPKKHKILVLDVRRFIADSLTVILEQYGFDVYTSYSGKRALELAEIIEPDLLLSAVMVPDKNGTEVAMAVRTRFPKCKVLLFSGDAAPINVLAQARASAQNWDILAEPIHPNSNVTENIAA
ncbi:MAG TPA: response regulator [Candidatus Angelobacter sp.]|nr:response regulator [Candidatus Angelobacter sp.]